MKTHYFLKHLFAGLLLCFLFTEAPLSGQSGGNRNIVRQGWISEPATSAQFRTGTLPDGSTAHRWDVSLQSGRTYTFTHCSPGGSDYDDWLLLYDDNGVQLVSNDDTCGLKAQITYTPTQSGLYWLVVSGFSSHFGTYTTAYWYEPPATEPSVSTNSVSNIGETTASGRVRL